MNRTLLVITVGQTDVQLVENGCRREFSKRCCAELHEQIEQRTGDWRVVDSPTDKSSHEEVKTLPDGPFELCTPKLDAVLQYLGEKGVLPTDALILETQRDIRAAPGDPRAAGLVLERRLRERFGSRIEVTRSAYLKGAERLEDRNDARDAVVRREIVTRIDDAVRTAAKTVQGGRIFVAALGGFPRVATLVDEVVLLHAGRVIPVELIEVPDSARAKPGTQDRAVPRRSVPEPVESYRVRRHALSLIENGNLVAAWGAVKHLAEDEAQQKWTRIVEWLYRFAASLPIPEECDIPVLRHPRLAVRAGLRVELALRADDIPRAVHGTVAFFEAALWDHLRGRVTQHREKRLFELKDAPPEDLVRKGPPYQSKTAFDNDRRHPFIPKETSDGSDWYAIDDSDICAIQLATHYLTLDKLTRLGQAVRNVRELRNDVAHNEPTPKLMADARQKMAEAKLWSNAGPRFLTQQLIQDVLNELGVKAPEQLCDDLIATVRSRLVQPS
jgi:hypothetical protein